MHQPYPEQTVWSFSKLSVILVLLPETKWASKPKLCYGNLLELCLNSGNISSPWKESFIFQWHYTFYTDVSAWIVIEMCPASLLGSFFEASTTLSAAHWTHGSKRVAQKCFTKHSLNLTWHDKSCLHFWIDCLACITLIVTLSLLTFCNVTQKHFLPAVVVDIVVVLTTERRKENINQIIQ